MADASVTRKALSLGTRDTTTYWCAKEYDETTIKGSFDPQTAHNVALAVGMPLSNIPYMSSPFYTGNMVKRGDHIEHDVLGELELEQVVPVTWFNECIMYACKSAKIVDPADRAATSGTWHLDSDSVKTDPRNRVIAWLNSYIVYGVCDYQIMFAGVDYPLEREFIDNELEIVSMVDVTRSVPGYTYNHYPYKFDETCTITNLAKDTAVYTATNVLESFEQAIRTVASDHPIGSIRKISRTSHERVNIGGMWLWQNTVTIEYTRMNDDYAATYPRITWGPSGTPTGTFYFPNCVNIEYYSMSTDAKSHPPSFVGDIKQPQGAGPLRVTLTCDLDLDNATYTWMRPQTSTPKTDCMNWQVFADIDHNGGIDEPYQTLTLDWGYMNVRLVNYRKYTTDSGELLEVTFEEYTNTDQSGNTIVQRWNIA